MKKSCAWLVLPLLLCATAAWAQTPNSPALPGSGSAGDGALHMLRPIIHAEQDHAELCLEFDHPLDGSDRARNAMSLKLESEGKRVPMPAQNVAISGASLCVPQLDHRRAYRLTLSGLKGSANEKLAEPYLFSFTVPDRKASLAFLSDLYSGGIMRWQNNDPVLRSVNVPHVKIELFRIDTLPLMLDAWRQHKQTTLAPSESAYFARNKGQLVWQKDLALDDTDSDVVEQKINLHEAVNLTPGFYLVVASAPQVKASKAKNNELAPLAAVWLLRSNLKIRALRDKDGYSATAEKADAGGSYPDVRLILEDASQQSLAESTSDADGLSRMALSGDTSNAATTLVGLSRSGDVDFADVTQTARLPFLLPALNASLQMDKDFYAPGDVAAITLTAQDGEGKAALVKDSFLQILRPERSLYTRLPVTEDKNNTGHLSLAVPAGSGTWFLQWQQGDGKNLVEAPLQITTSADAPRLSASADRAMIGDDNNLTLNITSQTAAGRPAPYIAGKALVAWGAPDTIFAHRIFATWDGYRFGNDDSDKSDAPQSFSFLTDAKGQAQLRLNLAPPSGNSTLRAAFIRLQSDAVAGAASPPPLVIPLRPTGLTIGIKPLAEDGHFSENSMARFDVVAVDGDGRRRDAEGLTYQITEEGRSFDWYQDEGRWNYKPLEQTRRLGGGPLNLKNDNATRIDWPVNAGSYRLVIRDASDKILAQMPFSAGWSSASGDGVKPTALNLLAPASLRDGDEAKIHFKLDQPAMITAVIADDRIRKIIHAAKPAGDNAFGFTPEASWNNHILVTLHARSVDADGASFALAGQIALTLRKDRTAAQTASAGQNAPDLAPLSVTGAEMPVLETGDQLQFPVTLKNNTTTPVAYRYSLTAPPGVKIANSPTGVLTLAAGQSRDLLLALTATQAGTKEIKLDLTGPRNTHTSHNWTFAVLTDGSAFDALPQQEIAAHQNIAVPGKNDKGKARLNETGYLFVAPHPLQGLPGLLAATVEKHAFTAQEMADELEFFRLWHDALVQTDLVPEQKWLAQQHSILLSLAAQQKADGGFPDLPDGDSAMASTAAAVTALSAVDQPADRPLAKQALTLAADWLRRRLENSWVDDKERSGRASAYTALAAAGLLDQASLHYFADTSAGKDLTPLAAAQLSLAFAKIKDQDKAIYWLQAIKADKDGAHIAPELLPLLAENYFYDEHNLLPSLAGLMAAKNPSQSYKLLRALWFAENRAGPWRVSVNGREQNANTLFLMPLPEKNAALTIGNPNDQPLFALAAYNAQPPAAGGAAINRRVFLPNGIEIMDGNLERGQYYAVRVDGAWPDSDPDSDKSDALLVRDPVGPALTPVNCAIGKDTQIDDSLAWLKNDNLDIPDFCAESGSTLQVLLRRADTGKNWHISYLAKAERSGRFQIGRVQIRIIGDDDAQSLRQGAKTTYRVR